MFFFRHKNVFALRVDLKNATESFPAPLERTLISLKRFSTLPWPENDRFRFFENLRCICDSEIIRRTLYSSKAKRRRHISVKDMISRDRPKREKVLFRQLSRIARGEPKRIYSVRTFRVWRKPF